MTRRRVQGAGLSLAVTEEGDVSAPTVVLVHGYPDTSAVWDLVAVRLAARFHVVAYDVRGAGGSEAPVHTDGYRLALLVDDLAAVIDAVSPDRPVHLVGHDWGSIQSWEAITSERLAGRVASYTSISGPPLDHVAHWARQRLRPRPAAVRALAGQAVRSSYVTAFHVPGVAWVASLTAERAGWTRRVWARALTRAEDVQTDAAWPAPTFAVDAARGMHLYLANVRARMRHPGDRRTEVPVQLVVPAGDRFVPPRLLNGLERWSPTVWRREVQAGHWVLRSHPEAVARWVSELVDHVEGGPEPAGLRRHRVGASPTDDRLVLITGAGSGIGRATALAFAERGATVIAADINGEAAARTAELCGVVGSHRGHPYAVDVGDTEAIEAFAKSVEGDLGVPDVVVNNAGIGMAGPFLATTVDDWDAVLRVNLWGVIHGCRLFGQRMAERAEGGHIVNVASAAAFLPSRNYPAYATTKAAVLMLTECLRAELAGSAVGVSAICPGLANTGIISSTRYVGAGTEAQDRIRRRANRVYERRGLTPEAVAAAVLAAVDGDLPVVPVGSEAVAARIASRLMPRLVRRLARVNVAD
jgi:NAD(P)-dependent dehydrogenase (short-subunit alcohol dehydrogenase family)/pimeloyl-ACP methyl ester carboxylesterase